MGWSIGFEGNWDRDIGYGVPSVCDHPGCNKEIDRGLYFVCGGEPYGGEHGCGLFFCSKHLYMSSNSSFGQRCERCRDGKESFEPTSDVEEWKNHKKTHESWEQWREENPELAECL